MLQEIDTVLFDFDGTLVEIDIDFAGMRQGVLSLGLEYGISVKSGLYVLESLEDIFERLMQRDESQAKDFRKRAQDLIINIEVDAATKSRITPEADRTLRELRARNIRIGIVTRNCRAGVIKSAGMMNLTYDILLTRDDVKKVKPDPQHLLDALNMLDSKPGRSLMVGNHPMDIVAGKRARMKTAAVLTTMSRKDFEEVSPDLIFEGVVDLLKIL